MCTPPMNVSFIDVETNVGGWQMSISGNPIQYNGSGGGAEGSHD